MIKAVIFDMYETLITHYESPLYFSKQMALDAGIPEDIFQTLWKPTEHERTMQPATRKKEFVQAERPLEVLEYTVDDMEPAFRNWKN